MAAELKSDPHLEIAHVLFIDVVGYSKLLMNEQSEVLQQLNQIVRSTEQFRKAEAAGKLIRIPVGDGMALVFFDSPETPVRSAVEISEALQNHPQIQLRMGIHSGPVNEVLDVNDRSNVAGAGINMAQRVMECGDAGHILLSKRVADDLAPFGHWRSQLHDLGDCDVKHGESVFLVNFYNDKIGNRQLPQKLRRSRQEAGASAIVEPARVIAEKKWIPRVALLLAGPALAIVALLFLYGIAPKLRSRSAAGPSTTTGLPAKSIAVLPFENLSKDEENAYFAGGIQDDILTNLAKIGDLKVISRTSVAQYKSKTPNVHEIGKALGVATVLEGSVRRAGNRVRVNVQLIDASTDQHIWAEDFDRDLTDVFAIQSDLALQIASVLQAKLSSGEKARVQRKPTENAQAYLLYLQALDTLTRAQSNDEIRKVEALFEKAIQLDSLFALAFAKLSVVESLLFLNYDTMPGRLEKARATAKEAVRLQPTLPEAHFALGSVFLRERDYDHALEELTVAKAGLPNDADVFALLGAVKRRQGKWAEAIADLEKAASLNPKDAFIWMSLAESHSALRQFADAAKAADRGCVADPNFFAIHGWRASLDIKWKGDTTSLEQLLTQTPEDIDPNGSATLARFQVKLFQRKYPEALQTVASSHRDSFSGWVGPPPFPKSFLVAQAYRLTKDQRQAQDAFEEAKRIVQSALAENPIDAPQDALLGEIEANLGQKEEAIREGKRAVELLPESRDAMDGPLMTLALARIYATLGDSDSALSLIEHSLSSPRGINVPTLRLDPVWDPIRSDPRFEKLLAKFVSPSANP